MNTKKLMTSAISFLIPLSASLLLLTACNNKPTQEESARAEQLIEAAHKSRDYQRLIRLADSLEANGSLTPARAYYWRGYASDRTNRWRMAEFYFSTALKEAGSDDPDVCAKAASHLANLMALRGDYQNGLKLATPIVRQLEELKCDTTSDYTNLLIYIGCCQAGLAGNAEATADGFNKAYERHLDNVKKNRTDEAYKDAIAGLINIAYACNYTGNYRDALKWNGHLSDMLSEYEQRPAVSSDYVDKQQARHNLYQAQALQGLGKSDEAAKAFDAFLTTTFAKTPEGRIMANEYLIAAERWGEVADNYQSLDALFGDDHTNYTLENIQKLVLKKYQANLLAGRRDTAAAISMLLCDSLASAFQRANEVDAAEQAVIISKVEELGDQQIAANRRLQLELFGLIGLLFIAVIGYVIYRRHHHYQLHKAHKELRKEYDELEVSATERSRKDTEQQIAAAIQQHIAYKPLPPRNDLTVLVSQTPGTMAGGSFCDTILRGDTLLFAIGSATGRGIAAATTTAMAWAQFRTAAAISQEPSAIVSAISQAIAEGNLMPVQLFVGALHISNGDLLYCNAGNNTPLLYREEFTLLSEDECEPAGTQADYAYSTQHTVIDKNRLLFLYTNGIAEATAGNDKKLGDKHLRGMALQAIKTNASPESFFQNMLKAITDFTGDAPQADDHTLMVITRH